MEKETGKWAIAIHGGAANLKMETNTEWWTESLKKEFYNPLEKALKKGLSILERGGSALDATVAVVVFLEDCEWFNAGKGGYYTTDGTIELDASIMDGKSGHTAAVGALRNVKNPILLAKKLLDEPTVMMVGEGAKKYAIENGLEIVNEEYFASPLNKMMLAKALGKKQDRSWHDAFSSKYGTVGAVALDRNGGIVAATSTGGIYTQPSGRVGDTANIGAGTYANELAAVSCTGEGEGFIKRGVARDIVAKMRYLGLSLEESVRQVIHEELVSDKIDGGVIAVDREGNVTLQFNTDSMMRGWATSNGEFEIRLAN